MRAFSPALLLVAAVAAGAAMDATIKYLAQTNNVLLVTFGRYFFGALFSLGVWVHAGRPTINAEMWRIHALRGLVIACCSVAFFWSLTVLPLAEAIALSFIYPLIIPIIAALSLGERLRTPSLVAAGLGFAGVAIAAQGAPSAAQSPLHSYGVAAVLFSAVMFAIAMVMMRARAPKDGAVIVSLMSSLMPGLILAAPAIALAPPPNLADWPGFLLMGAIAASFMYLMAHAYAGAEAQRLAPIHYTELIWASVLGYLIFQEMPRVQIYLGAVLIIAACLYVAYDERRLTLKAAAPPP